MTSGQKDQHIASQLLLSFVIILQSCYKRLIASQKDQHITHVATIFCNHLAKMLQKIVAFQKTQQCPTHRIAHAMLLSFVVILQSCYNRS